jgi:hypothetical protein
MSGTPAGCILRTGGQDELKSRVNMYLKKQINSMEKIGQRLNLDAYKDTFNTLNQSGDGHVVIFPVCNGIAAERLYHEFVAMLDKSLHTTLRTRELFESFYVFLSDSREPPGPRAVDTTSVQSLMDSLPGLLLAFKYVTR